MFIFIALHVPDFICFRIMTHYNRSDSWQICCWAFKIFIASSVYHVWTIHWYTESTLQNCSFFMRTLIMLVGTAKCISIWDWNVKIVIMFVIICYTSDIFHWEHYTLQWTLYCIMVVIQYLCYRFGMLPSWPRIIRQSKSYAWLTR